MREKTCCSLPPALLLFKAAGGGLLKVFYLLLCPLRFHILFQLATKILIFKS